MHLLAKISLSRRARLKFEKKVFILLTFTQNNDIKIYW
jgi:hypothetical protein